MEENKKISSFEDLIVWQKADLLFDMICEDVKKFPNNRGGWVLTDQSVRSISSISANIAEGYGSGYKNEYIRSLRISRREASESLNWMIKCHKREFMKEARLKKYRELLEEVRKMINSLINRLQ